MRQAYDYWQDQPGLSDATEIHTGHETMGHVAQQHKCNDSHLAVAVNEEPQTLLGKVNLHLDTSKLHFRSFDTKTSEEEATSMHTEMCVINQ